ncbi:hypothetical protein [Dyella agri]|uniref:Uncharacterized protein n=1 Tax=Dyella agri TaxID=1926869 RepID=A0ABW8KJC0_9GAMM
MIDGSIYIEGPGYVLAATGGFLIVWAVIALVRGRISGGRGPTLSPGEYPVAFFLTLLVMVVGGGLLLYLAMTAHAVPGYLKPSTGTARPSAASTS